MPNYSVKPIGKVIAGDQGMFLSLEREYHPALQALDGFSHLNVLWWFSDFDNEEARSVLETPKPYQKAPDVMGIFATRSPVRPNPIGLSTVEIIGIDYEKGLIQIGYIDANPETPILDLKPYTPSMDKIESCRVPQWCSHWPKSAEESGAFDWESEFLF